MLPKEGGHTALTFLDVFRVYLVVVFKKERMTDDLSLKLYFHE